MTIGPEYPGPNQRSSDDFQTHSLRFDPYDPQIDECHSFLFVSFVIHHHHHKRT